LHARWAVGERLTSGVIASIGLEGSRTARQAQHIPAARSVCSTEERRLAHLDGITFGLPAERLELASGAWEALGAWVAVVIEKARLAIDA